MLRIGSPTPHIRDDSLWNVGVELSNRFDENGVKQDLEGSIEAFRDCLAVVDHSQPRWMRLLMLGRSQAKLCMTFDSADNFDEAISTLDECLKVYPATPGIGNQPGDDTSRLANVRDDLGHLYLKRFVFRPDESLPVASALEVGPRTERSKECEEDLNVAILNLEESHRLLRVCSQPIPWPSRNSLAKCYSSRFEWLGDRECLEKSIELCRIAMSESSPDDESYIDILPTLADRLHTKYTAYGSSEDLHEAILHIERALELCPDNTNYRRQMARMYRSRFTITNDVGDLDAAISETRQCLDSNALQGSDQAVAVRQLATSLLERFQTTRVVEDLEEAIEMVRELVDELRRGITTRSNSDDWLVFCEYGDLLDKKFEVTGNITDLQESLSQYEMALRSVPYHSIHRPTIMLDYAGSLLKLYENTDKVEDLHKSIDLYREANDLTGGADFNNLYHCGVTLMKRVELTHKRNNGELDESVNQDLKDSLRYLHDAENVVPPEHPIRSQIQAVLARAYLLKGGSENQQITFELFERAVNHTTATPRDRLRAGRNWITNAIELQDFKEATHAYSHIMDTLYHFLSNPTVASQHQLLHSRKHDNLLSPTFASDAAYAAIKAGDPKRSVELLEQGRGLLWSRLNHYQYPLDRLKEVEPTLAKKYEELSKRLEALAISPAKVEIRRTSNEMIEELHAVSKEWDDVVEQIRKLEGFSDFHRPLGYDSLKKAATDGPVIIINISVFHEHSDAIIIHSQDEPIVVPLPDAIPVQIVENCDCLRYSLDTLVGRSFGPRYKQHGPTWWQGPKARNGDSDYPDDSDDSDDEEDRKEIETRRSILRHVLRFLWNSIVQPVVEKLQELSIQPGSRIWWCPTSFACMLPLHAAGPYKEGQHNLFDLYISSYLRCLSSSHHVRQATNPIPKSKLATSPSQLLVISCPGEPGTSSYLDSVESEVEEMRKCFSSINASTSLKVLDGPQADPESVIAHLPQYPSVHFSCHGNQDPEPFKSSFQVYGGEKVTLLHLMQARNPDAELAFLSACDTAAGDAFGTPDGVIHLVSTIQFIGFKSIVGTLWTMYDTDGPELARDFYGYLLGEGKGDYRMSAVALHEATKKMRDRDVPLERWVNFVHFGA